MNGRDGRDGVDGRRGDRGPRGGDGPQGISGKGAFEIAVLRGFTGTEREWVESLHGRDGSDGLDGKQGEMGPTGPRGPIGPTGPKGDLGDMPRHEWDETKLRFEQGPTGETWGPWVDLKGPGGTAGAMMGGGVVVIEQPGTGTGSTNSYYPSGW